MAGSPPSHSQAILVRVSGTGIPLPVSELEATERDSAGTRTPRKRVAGPRRPHPQATKGLRVRDGPGPGLPLAQQGQPGGPVLWPFNPPARRVPAGSDPQRPASGRPAGRSQNLTPPTPPHPCRCPFRTHETGRVVGTAPRLGRAARPGMTRTSPKAIQSFPGHRLPPLRNIKALPRDGQGSAGRDGPGPRG